MSLSYVAAPDVAPSSGNAQGLTLAIAAPELVPSSGNTRGLTLANATADTIGAIMMVNSDGEPILAQATKHGRGKTGAAQANEAFIDPNL